MRTHTSAASQGTGLRPRRRPFNLARDPFGVKLKLERLEITLEMIASRAGGLRVGTVSNVLSGRGASTPIERAFRELIREAEEREALTLSQRGRKAAG